MWSQLHREDRFSAVRVSCLMQFHIKRSNILHYIIYYITTIFVSQASTVYQGSSRLWQGLKVRSAVTLWFSLEDQLMLVWQQSISSMLPTRHRLQCDSTMFLTVEHATPCVVLWESSRGCICFTVFVPFTQFNCNGTNNTIAF